MQYLSIVSSLLFDLIFCQISANGVLFGPKYLININYLVRWENWTGLCVYTVNNKCKDWMYMLYFCTCKSCCNLLTIIVKYVNTGLYVCIYHTHLVYVYIHKDCIYYMKLYRKQPVGENKIKFEGISVILWFAIANGRFY